MMTSKKQIEANRKNALKSSGPKSAKGKAISRQNAVKHGLTAETVVAFNEDADKLEVLVKNVFDELQPGSQMESEVAERIATIMWRLRRIPQIEAGLLSITQTEDILEHARMAENEFDTRGFALYKVLEAEFKHESLESDDELRREAASVFELPQARLAEAFRRDKSHGDGLARLARYEGVLTRQLERSFALFYRLQSQRSATMKDASGSNDPPKG